MSSLISEGIKDHMFYWEAVDLRNKWFIYGGVKGIKKSVDRSIVSNYVFKKSQLFPQLCQCPL